MIRKKRKGNQEKAKGLTPGPVSIEDTRDTDINAVLAMEPIGQGLCHTFSLVITSARTDRIHMSPTRSFIVVIVCE